jgi:hypothetical protein
MPFNRKQLYTQSTVALNSLQSLYAALPKIFTAQNWPLSLENYIGRSPRGWVWGTILAVVGSAYKQYN